MDFDKEDDQMSGLSFGKSLAISLLTLILVASRGGAENSNLYVSATDAKRLVIEAIRPHEKDVALADMPQTYSPGFDVFELDSMNPNTPAVIGHVAVNRRTAEVWDLAGNCQRYTGESLEKMQDDLRRGLGVSAAELSKSLDERPNCDATE